MNILIDAVYNLHEVNGKYPYEEWMKLIGNHPLVPAPDILQIKGKWKEHHISGFSDKKILKELNKSSKIGFQLESKDKSIYFSFSYNKSAEVYLICLEISQPVFQQFSNSDFIRLFINLVKILPSEHIRCHETKQLSDLLHNIYKPRRSFLTPGLVWLNFFGKEEEIIQGGKELENNSFATRIERFENGLFIQVNETIEDCLTPAGLERLINATKAMPPVTPQEPIEIEIIDIEEEND